MNTVFFPFIAPPLFAPQNNDLSEGEEANNHQKWKDIADFSVFIKQTILLLIINIFKSARALIRENTVMNKCMNE